MRRILTVVIGLCSFCLHGCEDVVNIDLGKEKPVLVLNCILVEGDDTVWVAVSQTRPTRDTTTWKTFPEAEVQLFKNGEFVGQAEWNGKDCFVLPCRVEAEQTYRVVATVPGRGTVSGETTVPAKIKDYKLEIWQEVRSETTANGFEAKYHWQDLPDKVNHYWLTAFESGYSTYKENESDSIVLVRDTMNWNQFFLYHWQDLPDKVNHYWLTAFESGYSTYKENESDSIVLVRDTMNWNQFFLLFSDSTLPDSFNREKWMNGTEDGYEVGYKNYIRVEGTASVQRYFTLSYSMGHVNQCFSAIISLINADCNCDSYLKSIIENEQTRLDILEEPWLFRPKDMYSNIEGGTGIVGSYTLVETRLDSPNKPGKWGPGVPYRR